MRRTKSEALETRSALLDAAERVFYEKGVSQTTLTDIAKAAGVTRGAIYWHFADKAALFDAMQERGRLPQDFFALPKDEGALCNPLASLHRMSLEALGHLASNERSQRVCSIMLLRCEFVGEMADVLERMRRADEAMNASILATFELAESRALLQRQWDAKTASQAFTCSMTGLIVEWFRSEQSFDVVRTGESLLNALFASFTAVSKVGDDCHGIRFETNRMPLVSAQ